MSAVLTLFLAALLGISALHKLIARDRLATSTARLTGVAPALGFPVLLAAAAIELLAALALLSAPLRVGGALAAAGLWAIYGVALFTRRGQVLDCGCNLQSREAPVDIFAIARPCLLVALAVTLALAPPVSWTIDAPFAALALLALWFAASELALLPHLARISRR